MTSVNGVAYTWDNNGNLFNDGSKSYVYDQANRLTSVTASGLSWSASYNGDGARLRQVSNGVPTTYTLDLAAGLVQVLMMQDAQSAGGKTVYLYGVTRIGEQQPDGWAYHLADALGSVRQLVDGTAQVTLARGVHAIRGGVVVAGRGSERVWIHRRGLERHDAVGVLTGKVHAAVAGDVPVAGSVGWECAAARVNG